MVLQLRSCAGGRSGRQAVVGHAGRGDRAKPRRRHQRGAQSTMGRRDHLCADLAGVLLHRVHHRRLHQKGRRLGRLGHHAHRGPPAAGIQLRCVAGELDTTAYRLRLARSKRNWTAKDAPHATGTSSAPVMTAAAMKAARDKRSRGTRVFDGGGSKNRLLSASFRDGSKIERSGGRCDRRRGPDAAGDCG